MTIDDPERILRKAAACPRQAGLPAQVGFAAAAQGAARGHDANATPVSWLLLLNSLVAYLLQAGATPAFLIRELLRAKRKAESPESEGE